MKCSKCNEDCLNHYFSIGEKINLCVECYRKYSDGQKLIPVTSIDYDNYKIKFMKEKELIK